MPKASPTPPPSGPGPSPAALQVQILATEHWSLLASRTTTQNEVLTRISMFLTFVSAVLVSLALIGQATAFGPDFPFIALSLLIIAVLVGVLTQVRVFNVAGEDMMYVIAMNRLRAAYVALAPEVAPWLIASTHDDRAGVERTYSFFARRNTSVVLGSSMVFIAVVNGALLGLIGATLVLIGGGVTLAAVIVGIAVTVVFVMVGMALGYGIYARTWRAHTPISPS